MKRMIIAAAIMLAVFAAGVPTATGAQSEAQSEACKACLEAIELCHQADAPCGDLAGNFCEYTICSPNVDSDLRGMFYKQCRFAQEECYKEGPRPICDKLRSACMIASF